jgi:sterol desaturase/sphingolipid hydroxylase (fatty acid hydroxylase superfamily)
MDMLINLFTQTFGQAQQLAFEGLVQPLLYRLGFAYLLEDAYAATGWVLVGLIQIALMLGVISWLERLWPVHARTDAGYDHAAVKVDVIYTLIHRLGAFRLVLFFTIDPLWDALFGQLALGGWAGWHLDQALAPLWPGVSNTAWFAFIAYLIVFDAVDYALHRAQHHFGWWWALHALHHSQRQMTMWSDNRNHVLDDILRDSLFVIVAKLIGVAPDQFMAVVALTQLLENLSHANVRTGFGAVVGKMLVSPRFHRLHHAIGLGHESGESKTLGGHNFAVLFPVWDLLFGTARFDGQDHPTGVRDQLPNEGGRNYGQTFVAQQVLGVRRLVQALRPKTEVPSQSNSLSTESN